MSSPKLIGGENLNFSRNQALRLKVPVEKLIKYLKDPKEKPTTKCYLKIGAVAENNKRALQDDIKEKFGDITENMVVWYDSLVIGKTRKKVMDNVEKDK